MIRATSPGTIPESGYKLRSQYAVAYKPADFQADGRYRSIDITADNKKYHVRARKGYYAPTQ